MLLDRFAGDGKAEAGAGGLGGKVGIENLRQHFRRHARAVLALREGEGLDRLLWSFVGGRPQQNRWSSPGEVPAETPESRAMSKELKRRGFAFVGPTVCYAFMQAVGLVNDHATFCFRHRELADR